MRGIAAGFPECGVSTGLHHSLWLPLMFSLFLQHLDYCSNSKGTQPGPLRLRSCASKPDLSFWKGTFTLTFNLLDFKLNFTGFVCGCGGRRLGGVGFSRQHLMWPWLAQTSTYRRGCPWISDLLVCLSQVLDPRCVPLWLRCIVILVEFNSELFCDSKAASARTLPTAVQHPQTQSNSTIF